MAGKRARFALVLGGVLSAAGGVAVNRVGGSGLQQAAVFAVACACFIGAGAAARFSGGSGSGLRLRTADADGALRQLGDLELGELGVHWSGATDDGYGPYVERDTDHELNEAISGGQSLVAVSGAALAGRTRTLAEAARLHLPGSWLAWFEDVPGARLADLVAEAQRLAHGGPVVLWLENADLALLSQFSAQFLDALPHGFRIFMTLDGDLLTSSVLPSATAEVLNAPMACTQLGLVTAGERERLAAQPVYAQIAAAHEDQPVLMGRLMVSLDRVTDALQTPDEDAICRVAVLHVAVDWQRTAVPESLTREVIEKLYRAGYWRGLSGRRPEAAVSRSGFRNAIRQLLAPAPGNGLRLLDEVYSGRGTHLRPHPLLSAVADSTMRPPGWEISEILWDYLAKALSDEQRLAVGLSACSRGDYQHARRMLDPLGPAAPLAAEIVLAIAVDAHEAGDLTAARIWYHRAVTSGDADIAPRAMSGLGLLESTQGRIDEARALYGKAIASGHPDALMEATFSMGDLERNQRRLREARAWYAKAATSGRPDFAPVATLNVGLMESEQGHVKAARAWYTRAAASGHPLAAPVAMLDLGLLEEGQGRTRQARAWYEKAIDSGQAEAAPKAMFNLGVLDERNGRMGDARALYAKAIASGHPDSAPRAMLKLGFLEHGLDRIDEARALYAEAIASGHTDVAPRAMLNLGVLVQVLGHIDDARDLYGKAVAAGHPYAAPRAMFNLALVDERLGRTDEARAWYAKVIDSGDADQAAKAMFNLGNIDQRLSNIDEARAWYAKVIDSGHPEMASRAQVRLEELRRRADDLQRAENALKYGSPYVDADFDQHLAPPKLPHLGREDENM